MRDDAILWLLSHEVEDGILCVAIIFHCTGTSRVSTNHGISSLCIVRHISLTDVRKGSQVRWTVWADRQQHKGQLQLHLLWEPHEDWIPYVLPRWWGTQSFPCMHFNWWLSLWESPSVHVSWYWGSPYGHPVPSKEGPQSFPHLFQKTPCSLSNFILWVSTSVSVRGWAETLRGQLW